MLQWMGGGRRKVKTTKKSIQARQHQFFEQRRQQLRSQTVQELNSDKFSSRQHENIASLDIASLKNLSQLAQLNANNAAEGSKCLSLAASKPGTASKPDEFKSSAVSANEFKKTLSLEEYTCVHQNGNLHCAGIQQASTVDTAAHVRATVGTQWTPASAAAATALLHPEAIASKGVCATSAKDLHLKNEDLFQERRTLKTQACPKQENNTRINHVQKRPLRQYGFEQFQILDLINDSHDSARGKKDARSENYAAYVLEGMGNVPNCTPKIENLGHKNFRFKERVPACNSKHETQRPPQALKETGKGGRCKVQLQRDPVSTMGDDSEALTDLESFSDSNGEHSLGECNVGNYERFRVIDSGECKMRTYGRLKNQYSRKMNFWDRSLSVDSNVDQLSNWALFKEQDVLESDFPSYTYRSPTKLPKSGDFSLAGHMFPVCSDYCSADINEEMDDHMRNEILSDDDLRNSSSSLSSDDEAQSLQFERFTDDKLLLVDSSSPTASPQRLLEKDFHEFSSNNPTTEMFSESTFEFHVMNLDRSSLEKDLESPVLWKRKLDATHEYSNRASYVDMSAAHSQDDNEFGFFDLSNHDNNEFCAVGNLTAAVETESSSVDTVFGTNTFDFPSSPTSPLFHQPHHYKLAFGRDLR